ncbi:MAG TPA: YceI family protein [Flavobacteriaceae bacterium]|nr:YceI family protein [Flavobacteriaceae bacterium]MCB9213662.1 YceI family protein [Alteromonas sp.]HPF12163.1 YceI family protein [Flavobacteriaceae bacterium]HQU22296.1 YceI family protein [Flavobacteriaceae bacterium]HQU65992.1 YceI family protein [Flavobacteriaceae bacterium]
MKKRIIQINLFTLALLALISCKNTENEAETGEAQAVAEASEMSVTFNVNTENSVIKWSGSKPTGTHTGTVMLSDGAVTVKDGKIEAGKFTIDMNTITDTDLEGGMKDNLEAHLKGTAEGKEGDFFNVNEFPTATFELTGIQEVDGKTMMEGNLTLKGTTNHISFPATVKVGEDSVGIESETFSIDRTKWGVNFGSKSVFDNLGDKFINDNIDLTFVLMAKKN